MPALLTLALACTAAAGHLPAAADSVDTLRQTLRQVTVSGQRVRTELRAEPGASVVGMGLLRSMPRVLGNADPMRYAQSLPGVQTNAEMDAGLHIQGSDNAHNIVSIGGVPIYNTAHLLGFFSVFNATHFASMRLAKSPAAPSAANRLGGSVDMAVADTVARRASGDVAVGPLSSQATLTLPAGRRASLTLSARAAYANLLYSRWLKVDGEELSYFFHDYNLTLTLRPNERNLVWLEAYYGGDDAGYAGGDYSMHTSLRWGNAMAALHWRHHAGALAIEQCAYFTRYHNRLNLNQATVSLRLPSSVATAGYKASARWRRTEVGIDAAWHSLRPQEPSVSGDFAQRGASVGRQLAAEVSAWVGWRQPLGRVFLLAAGLRPTLYSARRVRFGADPTARLEWRVAPGARLSLSGGLRHQYLLRAGFSDVGLPTEFWLASGYGQEPQRAAFASLVAEAYLGRRAWRVEAELYYKRLKNQVEYGGNVFDFLYDDYSPADVLLTGDGHNYGFNLLVERRKGRLTGWIGYSYGRARRRYRGQETHGWRPAAHERPHELNAVATLKAGRRWSLGAALVVASGTPYTRVERFYVLGGNVLADYGPLYGERLPPYVRLDLSASYDFRLNGGRRSGINVSLCNATAHDNVLFYRLKVNESEYAYRPFSFALRVMPSVNYYFSF